MINLPRQARDKHTEALKTLQQAAFFPQGFHGRLW
jgi:hypothetical protein